ncbi:MAG: hypothetical protein U0599_12605 [Vicinamibacteria bacterium]
MSTHTLEVAEEMCDRVSIILGGRIVASGTVDELRGGSGARDEALTQVFLRLTGGAGFREDRGMRQAYPFLLLPSVWRARNRARRRERGDGLRSALFGGIGLAVTAAIFAIVFWLSWQLLDYEELGDYLVRLGLSWLFLTFLSFVAFSAIVTSLSTFFLSEDLRSCSRRRCRAWSGCSTPASRRLSSSPRGWSSRFLLPVLLAIGLARCAPASYYLLAVATVAPFVVVPSALGSMVTLGLVSVFARRARDVLMLMGLLFAVALVLLLRFIRPERLLSVQSMPDVTAFFATLCSITPSSRPSGRARALRRPAGLARRPAPRGPLTPGRRRGGRRAGRLRPPLLLGLEQGPGGLARPASPGCAPSTDSSACCRCRRGGRSW